MSGAMEGTTPNDPEDESDDGFGEIAQNVSTRPTGAVFTSSTSSASTSSQQWGEAIDRAVFDSVLRFSRRGFAFPAIPKGSCVRMPWEADSGHSIWQSRVDSLLTCQRPIIPFDKIDVPSAMASLRVATSNIFPSIARKLPLVPWPQQLAGQRHNAIAKWRIIIEENYGATQLGRQLQEAALELVPDSELGNIVSDAFSERATSTLEKRGNSLLKFFIWCRKTYGVAASPIVERRAYEYVRKMINDRAAPTAPAAFASALNFAAHFVKMEGALEASQSLRLRGACHNHFLLKRMLKQSKCLRVLWVAIYEDGVWSCPDPADRIACGFFAGLFHSRHRFSGMQFANGMILDVNSDNEGYIEFPIASGKTQRTKESKRMFLPSVAPVRGVCKRPWAMQWMKERKEQGIDNFSCLLPSIGSDGKWIDHPASSSTGTKWMKLILKKYGVSEAELEGLVTHGCRGTSLAWCSKFGMSIEFRTLLAQHVLAHQVSCLTYSRDALSEPLRAYDRMLEHIRKQTFKPDESRSGRIQKKRRVDEEIQGIDVPVSPAAPEAEADEAEDDSEASVSSSSSSSSESEAEDAAVASLARRVVSFEKDDKVKKYVCVTSRILHLASTDDPRKLRCSRNISRNFELVSNDKAGLLLGCQQCILKGR